MLLGDDCALDAESPSPLLELRVAAQVQPFERKVAVKPVDTTRW